MLSRPPLTFHAFVLFGAGLALLAALLGSRAEPAQAAAAQGCDAAAYRMTLLSLTQPPRADLTIRITAKAAECALPETLSDVQVAISPLRGRTVRRLHLRNVASPGGLASVRLGQVARRQLVAATVVFGPQVFKRGQVRTRLRPDLVLKRLVAPLAILPGKPFTLGVVVGEPNRDIGSTGIVTVTAAGAVVGSATVALKPRQRRTFPIPLTLQTLGRNRLDVTITGANPLETTTKNNARAATVDVTEFQALPSSTIVPSLAGYGGQFNHHVYAALSRAVGVTDQNVGDMEQKMRALRPEFSRIFFSPTAFTDPDRMQSFVRSVLLAQSTGTTINITWQGGTLDVAGGNVQKFANVLIDLVRNRNVTNFRWLTLQNEPNRTRITMQQYEAMYRALDPYIQSIRGQVRYMGGDLVRGPDTGEPNQQAWFDYLAAHMTDILDAYSIHVFWDYWDTQKLQDRLTEVRAIVDAMPEAARKPLYVAEYGVRGTRNYNGVQQVDPGVWTDGTPVTQTNVSAFQHAWFDLLSARLGYVGTSKWDSYFGKYDASTQAYYMIGSPQNGWPLYPLYNVMRLMTTTVRPGWRVVGLDSVPDTSRLLAAYVGPAGQRTIIGLDTAGAQLNTVSPTPVSYSVGGLPPSKRLNFVVWNEAGNGLAGPTKTVPADANGAAYFSVPQQGVFVLTTEPVS